MSRFARGLCVAVLWLITVPAVGQFRIDPNDDCTLRGGHNDNASEPFGLFVKGISEVSYLEFTLGNTPVSQAKLILSQRDWLVNPWTIVVKGAEFQFDETTFTAWATGHGWPLVGTFLVDGTRHNLPWQRVYQMDLTSWYNANLGKTMSLFLTRDYQPDVEVGPIFEDKEGTNTGIPYHPVHGPRIEWIPAHNVPVIQLSVEAIESAVDFGESLSVDTFIVSNGSGGTLHYAITDNQPWLSVSPASGALGEGQSRTHTISYTLGNYGVGIYQANITVSDNGSSPPALYSSQVLPVTVRLRTVLPDLDHDGDVDQEDFGKFQACYGTSVQPGCEMADFNSDGAVNQVDFGIFLGCFSGADVPADKTCAD
ncbi:MAG: hypothetical protein GXY44_11710 [Phycisphaerales bacterium]|nr:hypothetical protein [Phycisphaerales bacterium]